MNLTEFVILFIIIGVTIRMLRALNADRRPRPGVYRDTALSDQTADRTALQGEIAHLKDRIAVLERLVTDTHGADHLDREIEALRRQRDDIDGRG